MRAHVPWITLIFLVFISVPAGAGLEDRLPPDTLIYLHWSGRSLTFDGSMLGQMVRDPRVEELAGFVRTVMELNIRDADGKEAFARVWAMAAIGWERPVTIALTRLSGTGAHWAVFLIDLGKDKPAFQKELAGLLEVIRKRTAEPLSKVTIRNTTYTILPSSSDTELAVGFVENVFFFAVGKGQGKAFLEIPPGKTLKTNEKFKNCMKDVSGKNEQFVVYIDVENILNAAEALVQEESAPPAGSAASQPTSEVRRIADALGVGKISALAAAVRIVDKGMYTKVRVFSKVNNKGKHEGLLMLLAGGILTDTDLAGVPEDADFVLAGKTSPKDLYLEIRRMVQQINPHTDLAIGKIIETMQTSLDVSLEKDILEFLGDTWIVSCSPTQGGLLTGTMFSIDVKDEEKLKATIARIEAAAMQKTTPSARTQPGQSDGKNPHPQPGRVSIEITKTGDAEIHYLRLRGDGAGMAFLPAWAVHKKKLYLSAWPQVIASAIENKTNPLTASAGFKALRARVSPKASMLGYVNTPEIMKRLYPLQLVVGTILMNAIAREVQSPAPPPLWPGSVQSVTKYLRPEISAVSSDKDGITLEGFSTGPSIMAMWPAALGAGTAVLAPSLSLPKPQPPEPDVKKAPPQPAPKTATFDR